MKTEESLPLLGDTKSTHAPGVLLERTVKPERKTPKKYQKIEESQEIRDLNAQIKQLLKERRKKMREKRAEREAEEKNVRETRLEERRIRAREKKRLMEIERATELKPKVLAILKAEKESAEKVDVPTIEGDLANIQEQKSKINEEVEKLKKLLTELGTKYEDLDTQEQRKRQKLEMVSNWIAGFSKKIEEIEYSSQSSEGDLAVKEVKEIVASLPEAPLVTEAVPEVSPRDKEVESVVYDLDLFLSDEKTTESAPPVPTVASDVEGKESELGRGTPKLELEQLEQKELEDRIRKIIEEVPRPQMKVSSLSIFERNGEVLLSAEIEFKGLKNVIKKPIEFKTLSVKRGGNGKFQIEIPRFNLSNTERLILKGINEGLNEEANPWNI